MRLIRCYVENFGTLHDFTYEFERGVNTVCEENGWGKTTFGVFVKAMFYGLEYAPRKKVADNERRKYAPWQGGNFGGSIEFAAGDKEYKLERYFGKRDKEDTFVLYDRRTGLVSTDYTENIGEELFLIDAASYIRSTYIPQNDIPVTMTDSINAKLSNLIENGNDINNYETACASIESHLKEYKKTGGRGLIAQLGEKIRGKQEEIEECESKAAAKVLIGEQIAEQQQLRQRLERQKEKLREALLEAGSRGEQAAKREHYDTLKKRVEEIVKQKEPYDKIFASGTPTEQMLAKTEERLQELERLTAEEAAARLNEEEAERLNELDGFFAAGCPDNPQIEMYLGESREAEAVKDDIIRLTARRELLETQLAQEQEKARAERESRREEAQRSMQKAGERLAVIKKLLVTCGILLLAAGIALSFVNPLFGAAGAALFVVFIVIAITRRPKEYRPEVPQETEEQEETAAALTKEMEELASELSAKTEEQERMREHYRLFIEQFPVSENDGGSVQLLAELKAKAMEYRSLSERETERKEQRRTLREEMQSLHRAIDGFLRGIDEKYGAEEKLRASYDMLHEDVREYEWLTAELDKSEKELESFQESNPEIDFKEETAQGADDAEGTEELQQQEKQLEEEIEAVNEKISSYRKDLDAVCVIADTQADVEEELEGLKTELAEAEYKADVLEKTLQYLREAKESFSTHYMGAMRRGFEKYASMLGGKQRVYLDVQLEAQIEAGGARKGSEYFSTGNRDFIGICTRLALVDALFEKEKPFLILDDPFVNLDDEKVAHAGELLEKLAEEYQILYLICHSSRRIQEKR